MKQTGIKQGVGESVVIPNRLQNIRILLFTREKVYKFADFHTERVFEIISNSWASYFVRSLGSLALLLTVQVLLNMASCRWASGSRRLYGTHSLRLQGQAKKL